MSRFISKSQYEHLKKKGKRLQKASPNLTLSESLELIAKIEGFASWHEVSAAVKEYSDNPNEAPTTSHQQKLFHLGESRDDAFGSKTMVCLETSTMGHLLYLGETGCTKSEDAHASVSRFLKTYSDTELYVASGHGNALWLSAAEEFSSEACGLPVESDGARGLKRIVDKVWDKYQERTKLFVEAGNAAYALDYVSKTGKTLPSIICVIDEFSSFMSMDEFDIERKEPGTTANHLRRLVCEARSKAIHFIFVSQRLKGDLPNQLFVNATERVLYKLFTPDALMFGFTEDMNLGRSEAMIQIAGRNDYMKIQTTPKP